MVPAGGGQECRRSRLSVCTEAPAHTLKYPCWRCVTACVCVTARVCACVCAALHVAKGGPEKVLNKMERTFCSKNKRPGCGFRSYLYYIILMILSIRMQAGACQGNTRPKMHQEGTEWIGSVNDCTLWCSFGGMLDKKNRTSRKINRVVEVLSSVRWWRYDVALFLK